MTYVNSLAAFLLHEVKLFNMSNGNGGLRDQESQSGWVFAESKLSSRVLSKK